MRQNIYKARLKKIKSQPDDYFKKGDEHTHNFSGVDIYEAKMTLDFFCNYEGWEQISELEYSMNIEFNPLELDYSLKLDY